MKNAHITLIRNGFLDISSLVPKETNATIRYKDALLPEVATILHNMAYYGYTVDEDAYRLLTSASIDNMDAFWKAIEPALKNLTGADRNMDKFVVYKNFPKEVMEKSQAEYWIAQLCMYLGFSTSHNSVFAQAPTARKTIDLGEHKPKVLRSMPDSTTAKKNILDSLVSAKSRWNDTQRADFINCVDGKMDVVEFDAFGFSENAANAFLLYGKDDFSNLRCSNATSMLRAILVKKTGLVEHARLDASSIMPSQLKFTKPQRRNIVNALNAFSVEALCADFKRNEFKWKSVLRKLHPGDYNWANAVKSAYNSLYNSEIQTFESATVFKKGFSFNNEKALNLLATRPGYFARRFVEAYSFCGDKAIAKLGEVVDKLDTRQLVWLKAFLASYNARSTFSAAPKGRWTRMKVFCRSLKAAFPEDRIQVCIDLIDDVLAARLTEKYGAINYDIKLLDVKFQTNDQKLATYGRGTSFDIPQNIKFLRSASYWENTRTGGGSCWFDNGWVFLDESKKVLNTCSWNHNRYHNAAIFSGDPVNSKELKGRACQMIDLYIDELLALGVRYCVWNIMCYSKIKFSDATEVLATLQMGEDAQAGKLYEPSRAQMVFPLKSDALTSYVAYVDLKLRKLVYMDADLGGDVSSTSSYKTTALVAEKFPAYLDYLSSIPSVYDLVSAVESSDSADAIKFVYSDFEVDITDGRDAFVFRPENTVNQFTPIKLTDLLT